MARRGGGAQRRWRAEAIRCLLPSPTRPPSFPTSPPQRKPDQNPRLRTKANAILAAAFIGVAELFNRHHLDFEDSTLAESLRLQVCDRRCRGRCSVPRLHALLKYSLFSSARKAW